MLQVASCKFQIFRGHIGSSMYIFIKMENKDKAIAHYGPGREGAKKIHEWDRP